MDTYFYKDIQKTQDGSFQYMKIPIEEIAMVGDHMLINVPRHGHYIRSLYFDMGPWGLETLEYFELLIDKVVVYRYTGEYIFIHRHLRTPIQKQSLFNNVITIPIDHIPMIHGIQLRIKISTQQTIEPALLGLYGEFMFYKPDTPLDGNYLIHQIQEIQTTQLTFRYCVKEIHVVVQNKAKDGTFDFSNVSGGDQITQLELLFNQNTKVKEGPLFFRAVQPYTYYTHVPDSPHYFYTYTFAIRPELSAPSGTCNFSRITNALLNLTLSDGDPKNIRIYAVSYNHLQVKNGLGKLALVL